MITRTMCALVMTTPAPTMTAKLLLVVSIVGCRHQPLISICRLPAAVLYPNTMHKLDRSDPASCVLSSQYLLRQLPSVAGEPIPDENGCLSGSCSCQIFLQMRPYTDQAAAQQQSWRSTRQVNVLSDNVMAAETASSRNE